MGDLREQGEYVWTSERCFILELLNTEEFPEVSLARTRVEPGVLTQHHSLSVLELYVIECGTGTMHLGDIPPYEVGPGDVVTIPAHTPQQIRNTGDDDLVFTCVCTPKFTPACYTSLE